jgi:hypothetical protein
MSIVFDDPDYSIFDSVDVVLDVVDLVFSDEMVFGLVRFNRIIPEVYDYAYDFKDVDLQLFLNSIVDLCSCVENFYVFDVHPSVVYDHVFENFNFKDNIDLDSIYTAVSDVSVIGFCLVDSWVGCEDDFIVLVNDVILPFLMRFYNIFYHRIIDFNNNGIPFIDDVDNVNNSVDNVVDFSVNKDLGFFLYDVLNDGGLDDYVSLLKSYNAFVSGFYSVVNLVPFNGLFGLSDDDFVKLYSLVCNVFSDFKRGWDYVLSSSKIVELIDGCLPVGNTWKVVGIDHFSGSDVSVSLDDLVDNNSAFVLNSVIIYDDNF